MMGSSDTDNPAYLIQFTYDQAWSCNDHTCLGRCTFDNTLFNSLEDVIMNNKSHFADNVEAACELGMISHKKSLITIFVQKHKIKNFIKKNFKNFNSLQPSILVYIWNLYFESKLH